jgi:hypothetical protein
MLDVISGYILVAAVVVAVGTFLISVRGVLR